MIFKKPKVLFHVKGMGFDLLLDTSVKHNLIDPGFLEFWFKEDYPPIPHELILENQRKAEEFWRECRDPFASLPEGMNYYPFYGIYEEVGVKKIRCKDGRIRTTQTIHFNFEIEGKSFSELFCVDESLWPYFTKNNQVVAILGTDFMTKHSIMLEF